MSCNPREVYGDARMGSMMRSHHDQVRTLTIGTSQIRSAFHSFISLAISTVVCVGCEVNRCLEAYTLRGLAENAGGSRRCDCASIGDASSILFYGPELDGLSKRLRAFFASAADGPFGRIIK